MYPKEGVRKKIDFENKVGICDDKTDRKLPETC